MASSTSPSRINGPHAREQLKWEQFVFMYRSVIWRTSLVRSLQEADVQDLAQQVLLAVASTIGNWENP